MVPQSNPTGNHNSKPRPPEIHQNSRSPQNLTDAQHIHSSLQCSCLPSAARISHSASTTTSSLVTYDSTLSPIVVHESKEKNDGAPNIDVPRRNHPYSSILGTPWCHVIHRQPLMLSIPSPMQTDAPTGGKNLLLAHSIHSQGPPTDNQEVFFSVVTTVTPCSRTPKQVVSSNV